MLSDAITKKDSKYKKRTKLPYNGAVLSFTVVGSQRFCVMFGKNKDRKSTAGFS